MHCIITNRSCVKIGAATGLDSPLRPWHGTHTRPPVGMETTVVVQDMAFTRRRVALWNFFSVFTSSMKLNKSQQLIERQPMHPIGLTRLDGVASHRARMAHAWPMRLAARLKIKISKNVVAPQMARPSYSLQPPPKRTCVAHESHTRVLLCAIVS